MTDQPEPSPIANPDVAVLRDRLVDAELRAAAREAGMIDLDGLKLLDRSAIQLNEKLEVADARSLMQRLRQEKPYLFAQTSSSSSHAPAALPVKQRNAMDMTLDEWRKARADLLRHR